MLIVSFVDTSICVIQCFFCRHLNDEKCHAIVCRYQESNKFEKLGYEDDFLRFLQNMISDVEKRIRRGHQRLALNNAQGSVSVRVGCSKVPRVLVSPWKSIFQ